MSQILIVDDVPENLKVLSDILQSRGYIVRVANSGQQALKSAQSRVPDLILLDILMPDMNGYEVCRQLKTTPTFDSTPVIFVSALDETLDKVQAFEAGGVDYIVKPFQAEEILIRIETQLKLCRLQKKLVEQIENQESINKQLLEANTRLENLLSDREEMLGIMAHDLGNILSVMALKLDILKEHYEALTVEKIFAHLDALDGAKDQMVLIITRLLDVAKIDDSPISVAPQLFFPGSVIVRVLEQYGGLASAKQITLNYEEAEEKGQLKTDPGLLEEVLSNLVSNAIKYSPDNTPIMVRLSWDGECIIEVEDKGLGLAKEDHARLFTKFARLSARPTRGEKSLGLGLYIVKKMIDAMGGTVSARSPGTNQGSIFTVRLPFDKAETP